MKTKLEFTTQQRIGAWGADFLAASLNVVGVMLVAWLGVFAAKGQSAQVPGFSATINGLHFNNSWPSVPDYTLNLPGGQVKLGDAKNGLCGGMVYTVRDCYDSGLLPPANTTQPAPGTPLFNYIVARLTATFDEADVNQYLSFIQMSDHDTTGITGLIGGDGLAHYEILQYWPLIKNDIDDGEPSPLGLVCGQEPATIGFFTGMQDLGKCHQVLAYGYNLNGNNLTINIWDPDFPTQNNATITINIGNPAHTTPITVSNWGNIFRGFFRTHYSYNDPRKPTSASFLVQAVSSPGISGLQSLPSSEEAYLGFDNAGQGLEPEDNYWVYLKLGHSGINTIGTCSDANINQGYSQSQKVKNVLNLGQTGLSLHDFQQQGAQLEIDRHGQFGGLHFNSDWNTDISLTLVFANGSQYTATWNNQKMHCDHDKPYLKWIGQMSWQNQSTNTVFGIKITNPAGFYAGPVSMQQTADSF